MLLFEQTKIVAARCNTTIKNLVIKGMRTTPAQETKPATAPSA